jgi:hypothetical protein
LSNIVLALMKIENVIDHSCHCLYCYVLLLVDVSLGTHLSASWRGCWMALFVITIESIRCALRAAASVESNVELPERCTRALYHNSLKKPNGGVSIRRRPETEEEMECMK